MSTNMLLHLLYNIIGMMHYDVLKSFDDHTLDVYIKPILFYFHLSYFITDSIYEYLYFDRRLYMIHHLLAIIEIGLMQVSDLHRETFLTLCHMFSYLECTSFIVNLREYLKTHDYLHRHFDLFLLINYAGVRGVVFPYFLYVLRDETIIIFIPSAIYIVSMIWLYQWILKLNSRYITHHKREMIKRRNT